MGHFLYFPSGGSEPQKSESFAHELMLSGVL